jgi:oligoendopeptidase F
MARRAKRSPIKIKKANQGKTRKATGTKKGQTVPVAKLQKMKNSKNPTTRKRATFALNARKWNNKKK